MNDNNVNNNTYRATRNLNTALESPEYKVEDTLDVNIKDVDNNNYVREQTINNTKVNDIFYNEKLDVNNSKNELEDEIINPSTNNTFINSDIAKGSSDGNNTIDNSVMLMTTDEEAKSTYIPTSLERKKKKPFVVPSELKLFIIIIIILLVFVFFMPFIYNLLEQIELSFFNR